MGNVAEVNEGNFQAEVLDSSVPVLVDFWAPWCGPCRAIAPVVEELAGEYASSAKIVKVNVDNNQELAGRYQIDAIPALLVFVGGQVVDMIQGAAPKSRIREVIDQQVKA